MRDRVEIWKPVVGYEEYYSVSNLGRIKSLLYPHLCKSQGLLSTKGKDRDGYVLVVLCKDGRRKMYKAHRIVASAFIQNPHNKPYVNHINNIHDDNRADNLEWCTNQENMDHAVRNNLIKPNAIRGSNIHCAFLDEDTVLNIRRIYESGRYSQRAIAKMFNLKFRHVNKIVNRLIWTHI